MQYRLVKQYLEQMREDQTLVLVSGHPMGVFTTRRDAPRLVSTNGLMVGMFDTPNEFHRACALGVANYGQMTAGGKLQRILCSLSFFLSFSFFLGLIS